MAADQLVGSEIHGFHTLKDLDVGKIVNDAGGRWLSGHEIHAILHNHKHFCVYSNPVNLPKSGAILLFDRKRLRNFRKDGHNWKKKKDGKTVNESHECLKVGNEERIHVYYVHGQDNPNFARRCYWLLDKNPERDIVLVHYRELKEKSGDKHVYYAGDKDFLESTALGDNLTVQNHEWRRHEINPMERDELPPTNDSNNSTAPKEHEVSSFDQSNQIEANDSLYDMMSQRKRRREDVKAQPEGSGSKDKRRRFPTFWNVVWEVMKMQSVQKFPEPILGPLMQSVQNFPEPILGPLIRRMVEEEVKRKLLEIMKQNCGNEASTSGSRSLQVNFTDNLSPPVLFSGAGIEGEDCSNIQEALVDDHIDQQPLSHDGEALANVHYPTSLPCTESPNGSKFLASGEIGEFDHSQRCALSPDIFSIVCSVGGSSGLDECGLQDLSFPGSMICDTHPMTQTFCGEDSLQDLDTDMQVEDYLLPPSTAITQMRWTKVFSVLNWFSIRKVVICKKKKLGSGKSQIQ
ncbi:uncharacterized protein LOC132175840 isoform X3 [Corylus avellana]|uniref:uncharacterized protein LOC132175840 isoform X3 n=1 Tax=Corylus avellana TaxID=13451 RepID=UPI00286D53C6|nr:uncharacterized protein LOC132175840 isoform X3 [Corylus avellana]